MACYFFQRSLYCFANLVTRRASNELISFTKPRMSYSSNVLFKKGSGRVSCSLSSDWCKVSRRVSSYSKSTSNESVKLAILHHGHLSDADGNGDWVLTIFTVLSLALTSNAEQALLSKNLATLRSDLPFYMVPFSTEDLIFMKPEDNGEKFTSLLTAISAYAEGFSPDSIIRKAFYLWKTRERQ